MHSRRDFIVLTGGMAMGLGAAGTAASAEEISAERLERKSMSATVVVAGGGLAGVCAAIGAARDGAKTVLIQDRSRLGGNSSSEIRMHVCGANNPTKLRLWRETGIIEELKLTESATNPQRSFEIWDLILYDKVVSEPNITLMLDTAVVDARVDDDRIASVLAVSPLLEQAYEIKADFFIDCTGDAGLAAAAGAEYMRGREGQDVYGESLAPPQSDTKTMGNSILFFAKKHDKPMPFTPPAWARKFTEEDFKHRSVRSWEYGYWWIEWGGEMDTIADNREIRHELLRAVMGVWDYIKNSGNQPESANWALDWVGMIPGKRESRRITGEHVMTQQELERAEPYPDRVSYGGWPMDDHPPGGIDRKDLKPCTQIPFEQPYHVPLRSLYSLNRPNLLMAGRNISASHVAFSSTRVMATCAAMGQAAGAAAAFSAENKCMPRDITAAPKLLARFQQRLIRGDQSLIGIRHKDEANVSPRARVTCSAETAEGKAGNLVDGWTRDIGDGSTHQWQAPLGAGPQWVCLEWDEPQPIDTIQIVFDSGLHRKLFLSGQDSAYNGQTRGPQPETVADYVLEAEVGGKWKTLATVKGNYLRLARHRAGCTASKVRLTVARSNGDSLARVFDIQCYA